MKMHAKKWMFINFSSMIMLSSSLHLSSCNGGSYTGKTSKKSDKVVQEASSPEAKASIETQKSVQEDQIDKIARNVPKDPGAFFMDYPPRYCEHVWKLKLRADVSESLKYFCNGATPTEAMIKLREQVIREPGKLNIQKILTKSNLEENEYHTVWGYYIPEFRPFRIKEKPFYTYIAQPLVEGDIDLKTTWERQSDEGLDFGMHLWSVKMKYELKLTAAKGLVLDSRRATQYNLYQVESGNEEMGFGVETLTDGFNGDYSKSVMINLAFNDGQGFNDDHGGIVVLNLLHLKMANKGFPETTGKSLDRIGTFLPSSMYEGLAGKKSQNLK